ncbi:TetR family transcriptional regulator [Humibacillus xanthopallidus]|uniref:TetR family transcriptional regulator n=1 Tax=Humibacillus xanthopallidus TaxID=412689 RepID=A0A543PLN4_9MICO|nr:TetR/AcrR family transcriptional regulator C-terminal domain-containing protein [Humibacillus xanthopallidus]TQN44987.1 TetR family transcriptional regulator [Humibacillus xanthopallidus]
MPSPGGISPDTTRGDEGGTGRRQRGAGGADQRLSRDRIIDEAIALVDSEGVNALTMRRLGTRLGVEAMALYRYVNGREDLLEGVVDRLVSSLEIDPGARMEPADGWQAFLQWMAHNVRQLALDHPLAFPLIATRHPAAPWLRPPLRSLAVVEEFLDGLLRRGFTEAQAVRAYRTFTSFLLGHLLLESASRGAQFSGPETPLDEGSAPVPNDDAALSLEGFPTLARLALQLEKDRVEIEFEEALESLLERMDLELSQ